MPTENAPEMRKHLKALRKGDWKERHEAVGALRAIRDPSVIPHLVRALSDADWITRFSATQGLGEIGHPSAIPHLAMALKDGHPNVTRGAERSLRQIAKAIEGRPAQGKREKALLLAVRNTTVEEDPEIVRKTYEAAFWGRIGEKNARLYVKQLRAMKGRLK